MKKKVKKLLEQLNNPKPELRKEAVVELHQYPEPEVVNALYDALNDADKEVRLNTAESLRVMAVIGKCRIDPEPLNDALSSEKDSNVRVFLQRAIEAIDSFF